MRVRIKHRTSYRYEEPTHFGPHVVRLRPADHTSARLLSYNLDIEPGPRRFWQRDPWGNRILRATFDELPPSERLDIVVDAAVEVQPVNPFDFFVDEDFEHFPSRYPERLQAELAPFLTPPRLGPKAAEFARAHAPTEGRNFVDWLVSLNRSVAQAVRYIIRMEPGLQTSEETLEIGSGSCRDSAVLLADMLRHHGLAARFVSGYLIQLTDEGNIPDEARGVDRDVVDLHAWAEVFVPGAGWIGIDGTSGLLTGEGHIPLAGTADPLLAGPVEGTATNAASELDVEMTVTRLGHEPRPRRPYTEAQWEELRALGRRVDEALSRKGIRLTMGGEPTWTSRLHPREKDWNGEALGPTKWAQGIQLSKELMNRLASGSVLLNRFGKHYPGESLPRWLMHLVWRPDGQPIWQERDRLDFGAGGHADEALGDPRREDAARLRSALSKRLGLPEDGWIDGFEDPWHFIREEEDLPCDVDPLEADLESSEERRRLARVLGRGMGAAVGQAMPLAYGPRGWTTDRWSFRRGHMFLIPGDSPMGLRLPLNRIGGVPYESPEQDPSAVDGPLAERQAFLHRAATAVATSPAQMPQRLLDREGERIVTALTVEARGGVLHVFLPPLPSTDAFLELVALVEESAAEAGVRVSLEGYPPPSDPRLRSCMVTPDPGVLEVNLPVTEDFDAYVELMELVSDAANHSGLTPERYQLDGRVAGSGGGHHLTLGGASTQESPFIQRPELLAGLLRFFQNHPALSYLFTGLFVGPTSQAPRVDEARHDALYELEIALQKLEAERGMTPPWLTDRVLRNLLLDVSGNTHRTEISIDKLYDPSHAGGRQGILKFRGFEMPPHEHMAAAQMLLVRAVVARLADRPYERPLVRWGSRLHDQFMLPHFLWADLQDVLRELSVGGRRLSPELYQPFFDFRCPLIGRHEMEDVRLELRSALEPWPVLGEEGIAAGTVRFVDSSVERVEVKADGLVEGRHVVTVNGWTLPLRPTGTASEQVAGVRFKAWQPPHGLQPTIPVHSPLRIDVVDTWAERSLGAATYHVYHPEGRGYDEFPLTAFEAAARRAQRFTTEGHAPHPAQPRPASPHPEQPFTLDLRRFAQS